MNFPIQGYPGYGGYPNFSYMNPLQGMMPVLANQMNPYGLYNPLELE